MKTLLLLLSLAFASSLYGQDTVLVNRIYFSPQEIIDHAPWDTTTVLKLIKRKKSDIKIGGATITSWNDWATPGRVRK